MTENDKLTIIEKRQQTIQNDIAAINEMLELLIARSHGSSSEKFRSHREKFGGYGAGNLAAKLRDRSNQTSEASRRKANRNGRIEAKAILT